MNVYCKSGKASFYVLISVNSLTGKDKNNGINFYPQLSQYLVPFGVKKCLVF